MSLRNAVKAFISGLGGKNLLNSLDFCCFLEKLAKKGQILKTFRDYNAQNLEEFEKNQLPFPVFGKIEKFREKKKLTSVEKSTSVTCFSSFEAKKVKFYKLFAKILR